MSVRKFRTWVEGNGSHVVKFAKWRVTPSERQALAVTLAGVYTVEALYQALQGLARHLLTVAADRLPERENLIYSVSLEVEVPNDVEG